MKRVNEDVSIEKERELISKLYEHMCHDTDGVENDIKYNYLTCNRGTDGRDYFWYLDESKNVAIDMDGNIYDEAEGKSLVGILYDEDIEKKTMNTSGYLKKGRGIL